MPVDSERKWAILAHLSSAWRGTFSRGARGALLTKDGDDISKDIGTGTTLLRQPIPVFPFDNSIWSPPQEP